MGAGASTSNRKKKAAGATAASPGKVVDKLRKKRAVDSGADEVEKVSAEATAVDKGKEVGTVYFMAPLQHPVFDILLVVV